MSKRDGAWHGKAGLDMARLGGARQGKEFCGLANSVLFECNVCLYVGHINCGIHFKIASQALSKLALLTADLFPMIFVLSPANTFPTKQIRSGCASVLSRHEVIAK